MTASLRRPFAAPLPLPPGLAQRLAGYAWQRNTDGQAGAAVFRLQRAGRTDLYLKHGAGAVAAALMEEAARLHWLRGHWPVPRLEHFEIAGDDAWLLTEALPGRTAQEWLADAPERAAQIVATLAQLLRRLHAVPLEQCPFNADHHVRLAQARHRLEQGLIDTDDFDEARRGWSSEQVWQALTGYLPLNADTVVCHGDFSPENILMTAPDTVSGIIDLGRTGAADRYQDLAILWNRLDEFGAGLQQQLFAGYGIAQPDWHKLDFHLCLDECF